jgi:hypothetical protein
MPDFYFRIAVDRSLAAPMQAFMVEKNMKAGAFVEYITTTHAEFMEFCERHNYTVVTRASKNKKRGRKPGSAQKEVGGERE